MKQFILRAGKKIRKLTRAGSSRYRSMLAGNKGDNNPPATTDERAPTEPEVQGQAPVDSGDRRPGAGEEQQMEKMGPPRKRQPAWTLDQFVVAEESGKSRFHDYQVPLPLMQGIADLGFQYCTPIQEKSLEAVLEGKDLVGKANTGTGKTAVFLIAILSRLLDGEQKKEIKGNVRALVLAPTRELVAQITKDAHSFAKYCHLRVQAVYGGVDYQKQLDALDGRNCDLVVATPGRLLDFIGKGVVDLQDCRMLVLDEADRMLDMGFIPDVRRIVGRLPGKKERQTMLFSATVPDDVRRLAMQWCVNPVSVEAEPEQVAVETVEQTVYLTTTEEKYVVLYNLIATHPEDRIIVFANMKNETRRLADRLERNGVDCVLLSGDVAQHQRMKRLERFRAGKVKVLVATDVAGRGIHIEGITFVVNFTLPYEPEDYVHRIGRTGRAGASGKAVSFACEEGSFYLPAIEEFIERKLPCVVPDENLLKEPPQERMPVKKSGGESRRSGRRRKPRGKGGRQRPKNSSSGRQDQRKSSQSSSSGKQG